MTLRIGSVPYLNAKPLVDWFHSPECRVRAQLTYAPPSQLARMLREGALDVANVSIIEAFTNPRLVLLPDISISAYGAVKSVRLFSRVPVSQIRSVALDTSSLTSAALLKILLREVYGLSPIYQDHPPQLETMLARYDAGLLIGDLKLFELPPNHNVYDLGQGWWDLTGKPFVYAAWLARSEVASAEMVKLLLEAKQWGLAHLEALARHWSIEMNLPLARCENYLFQVMNYDLSPEQFAGLTEFQRLCVAYELIPEAYPITLYHP